MNIFTIFVGSASVGILICIALSLRSICNDVYKIRKYLKNKEKQEISE